MKLEKAIEILADYRDGVEMEELREYPLVLSLAIEALRLFENPTDPRLIYARKLLLGETKD